MLVVSRVASYTIYFVATGYNAPPVYYIYHIPYTIYYIIPSLPHLSPHLFTYSIIHSFYSSPPCRTRTVPYWNNGPDSRTATATATATATNPHPPWHPRLTLLPSILRPIAIELIDHI